MPTTEMERKSILKEFHAFVLATVLAGVPLGASAMEALDEGELASVTGQDGISTDFNSNITTTVWFEDTTGYPDFPNGGFLTLEDLGVDFQFNVAIDTAADGTGGGTGATIIGFQGNTTLSNVSLGTQGSDTLEGVAEGADFNRLGNIANSSSVASVDSISVDINNGALVLGPQADLFGGAGTEPFLLIGDPNMTINNLRVLDSSGSGWIGADLIEVTSTGGGIAGRLVEGGLEFSASDPGATVDIDIVGVNIGNPATQPRVGDFLMSGVSLGDATVTVSGKP